MSSVLLAVVALLILLVLYYFFFLGSRSSSRQACVLMVGPCGSGKTLLFHRFIDNCIAETVSSMQPNEARMPEKGPLLVDFPGHYRLRNTLPAELGRAKRILFVFDASRAVDLAKPAAELLYSILATFHQKKHAPKILFLCNKSDKPAKTPQRVKLMMMNEIETLRKTANSIQSTDDINTIKIGQDGHFFNFDHHSPCAIDFMAFSAISDDKDALDKVRHFIKSDD